MTSAERSALIDALVNGRVISRAEGRVPSAATRRVRDSMAILNRFPGTPPKTLAEYVAQSVQSTRLKTEDIELLHELAAEEYL